MSLPPAGRPRWGGPPEPGGQVPSNVKKVIEGFFRAIKDKKFNEARQLLTQLETMLANLPNYKTYIMRELLTGARATAVYLRGLGLLGVEAFELLTAAASLGGGSLMLVILLVGLAIAAMTSDKHSPVYAETPGERLKKAKALLDQMPPRDNPLHRARAQIAANRGKNTCLCQKEKNQPHQAALGSGFANEMLAFNQPFQPFPAPGGGGGGSWGAGTGEGPRPEEKKGPCLYPMCREIMGKPLV